MRKRKSLAVDTDSFSVRWHSVADMNTPSADIMSSPDPLNDTVEQPPRSQSKTLSAMPPSTTRRIVRSSQRSSRFSSGGLGTSPRKQTFELEVGDNQAPQKLLVTVETEEPVVTAAPSSARRKLFQDSPYLPVARRREMATTTTVPLKQTIEDQVQDPDATPRKRGRPRKNNGTPLPSAGTKRKGTPIAGSPRRRQRISQDTDTAEKENTPQPTTGKKRRGRPPKNRSIEPPSDVGKEIEEATSDLKSAQQDVPVDDITFASNAFDLPPMRADDSQADNDVTLVITPSEAEANQLRANRTANNSAPAQTSEPDSDIWMATLDDEPTPRPATRATQAAPAPSSPEHGRDGESSDFGDYGYGPAGSDVSSADEPQSDTRPGPEDTVAAGEDFSMIFMDSLPSLQASLRSSMQEHTENDIGEETSMIINNTLESLRQSLQDRDRPQTNEETAKQGEKNEASKETAPAKSQQDLRQSTIRPPLTFSPNRNLSSRWLQSPRRPGSSPLRHQVLLKSNAPDVPETTGYRGSPLASHRYDASHLENEDSNAYDDSFSEIPDAVLEAATPRRPRATAKKASLEKEDIQMEDAQLIELEDEPEEQEVEEEQDRRVEEPEVEEEQRNGASPTAASNVSAVSRSDAGRLPTPDDTPPNIGIESDNNQKSATASRNSTRSVSSRGSSPRNLTTDPVRQVQAPPEIVHEVFDEVVEEQADKGDELLIDFDAPAQEPDDHSDLDDQGHQFLDEPDDHSDVDEQVFEETVIDDPVVAEPEVVQELPKVVEPQYPRLSLETEIQQPEVTPLNQLTSPVQEPQSQPEVVSERARRPTLSPIVRAGRALQSVTSDPPSPEARDQHLRSPFRSSASRELGPRESQTMRRSSASPGKSRAFPEVGQIPQGDEAYEDPFGTNSRHTGQQSFMEALERSSRTSSPRHRRTASRDSAASSTRFQAPSEGGMSWVQNEGPISPNLRGDVPLDAFARTTRREAPPVSHGQIDGVVDVPDDETEDAGDDMDLWEFEAQRSSPRAAPKPRVEKKPESPYRRRGKLPSRWDRPAAHETQRVPSDEQRTMSEIDENEGPMEEDAVPEADAIEVAPAEPAQPEEYSLVTQKEGTKEPSQAPATAKANRFDLSNFFSSPAIIPGMLDKLSPLKRMSVFGARPTEPDPEPVMEQTLPTSSMFPQIPQQELAPQGQPRLGFFSPVRPAQPAPRREPSEHSEEETYSQSNQSSPARRSEASSAHEEHDASMQEISELPEEREQQDDTEEEELEEDDAEAEVDDEMEVQPTELPSVPQKANFTPERRRPNQSFFKASTQNTVPEPEPEQESIPTTGAPTPPRMQLSHADIHRWTQETSNASDDSPEPTPAKPVPRPAPRPLLRPLPPRNASPTKSSLRSPLKPHTPGRVVEFTSSVLSPIEQAKVRHQRRLSNSSAGSQASNGAQRPRVRLPPRQTTNKENNTFENPVSNAGLPIKQTRPEPLSRTVWTRKHWLLLDDLLQERRQGPFITYYERCSDKYLGKMVRSQGEAMTLERWHLDCVDAFKAQVGGWDEGALAKRLFALILGERRRSQEASSGTGRVMFH